MAERVNGTQTEVKQSDLIEAVSADDGGKNPITVLKASESVGVKVDVNGDMTESELSQTNNVGNVERDICNGKETDKNVNVDDDSVSEGLEDSIEDKLASELQSKTQIHNDTDSVKKLPENIGLENETSSHKDNENAQCDSSKSLESELVISSLTSNDTNLISEVKGAEARPEVLEPNSEKDKRVDDEEEFRPMTEGEIQAIINKYSFMDRRVRTKCLQFFWSLDVDRWGYFNYQQLRYWFRAQGTILTDYQIYVSFNLLRFTQSDL